jgi:5-methylcytosine-specific restriction endonuclease McrA
MDAATRQLVRARADERCEYCLMPQSAFPEITFHVEHIVAKQHRGTDDTENLALACDRCNLFKGPNLSAIDPETRQLVPLFNPRVDAWHDHFRWAGVRIVGQTAVGRATVRLLEMNASARLVHRAKIGLP